MTTNHIRKIGTFVNAQGIARVYYNDHDKMAYIVSKGEIDYPLPLCDVTEDQARQEAKELFCDFDYQEIQ